MNCFALPGNALNAPHNSLSKVICGDFDGPRVVALRHQLAGMHQNSPPASGFALDHTGLKAFDISFYTAWQDGELLGMGALKELDPSTGEIKSFVRARALDGCRIQMEELIEPCRPATAERLAFHEATLAVKGNRRVK